MSDHDEREDYDDEPWRGRISPEKVAKETADVMWSFGMFQLGTSLLVTLMVVGGSIEHLIEKRPVHTNHVVAAVALTAAGLVGIAVATLVVRGSTALARLQGISAARVAAVLTVLSLPCVLAAPFSIPVGIWALTVLRRPDIRRCFGVPQRDVGRES